MTRPRSPSVLATIGGFLTPILLRSTEGQTSSQNLAFFIYITLLNGGVLSVSLFKQWRSIAWLSFIATYFLIAGWIAHSYTGGLRWQTFTFLILYYLLFLLTSCLYSLLHKEGINRKDLTLFITNTLVYFIFGFSLLSNLTQDYPSPFPLGLAFLLTVAGVFFHRTAPGNTSLINTRVILAILLGLLGLTVQVYVLFRLYQAAFGAEWTRFAHIGISLFWTFSGILLLSFGVLKHSQSFRLLAFGLLGITALKAFLFDLDFLEASHRSLAFGVLGLSLITIAWFYNRRRVV